LGRLHCRSRGCSGCGGGGDRFCRTDGTDSTRKLIGTEGGLLGGLFWSEGGESLEGKNGGGVENMETYGEEV
jgi:hypothetical protein